MICMARSFGAPDRVPAGKHAIVTSRPETPDPTTPVTEASRCMTCE